MRTRRVKYLLGVVLLLAAIGLTGLVAFSGWRPLSIRGPGDRWRVTLGSHDIGGGTLFFSSIKDPAGTFMFPFTAVGDTNPNRSWSIAWRLPPMPYNPALAIQPPAGWGTPQWRGVGWIFDAPAMREAAVIAWPLPIAPFVLGLWLVARNRPHKPGTCPHCGYPHPNSHPNPHPDACPECGHPRPPHLH